MRKQLEVNLDEFSSKFSSYQKLIESFANYKQHLRDIKLNTLLEGKKIQFDINDIKQIYGCIGRPSEFPVATLIVPSPSFMVKSLKFIIKDDDVISLIADIETLDNKYGKIIEELTDIKLELYHKNDSISKNSFYINEKTSE